MTPHVHANVIKAWADGAEIEYYSSSLAKWILLPTPIGWYPYNEYRIKPQPKPDVVLWVEMTNCWAEQLNCRVMSYSTHAGKYRHNLKLTFDGETGSLKSAEVI